VDAPGEGTTDGDAAEESTPEEGDAAAAASGSVELVFRTYKKKLSVKNWWWLDERGKRLGAKQKG
jgi:hypothetical protein